MTNQKYYPEVLASDIHVTSMEFLRSFLRRHFAGNGVVKFRLLSQAKRQLCLEFCGELVQGLEAVNFSRNWL